MLAKKCLKEMQLTYEINFQIDFFLILLLLLLFLQRTYKKGKKAYLETDDS